MVHKVREQEAKFGPVHNVHNIINKIAKSNLLWENKILQTGTMSEPKQNNF